MDADLVIIHARFSPDGTIVEISERPAALTPQDWFNFLSYNEGDHYQALSGGRGVFRVSRPRVGELESQALASAARGLCCQGL